MTEITALLFQSATGDTGFARQVDQIVQQRCGDPDGFLCGGALCVCASIPGLCRGFSQYRLGRMFSQGARCALIR
jgi:hypothetical protein